jgi:hypothetical protein
MGMGFARHPFVSPCQEQDHRGGREATQLKKDEHGVTPLYRKGTDEQTTGEPHRPGTTADTRRTVLAREVDHLGYVGCHRNHDSNDAEEFKHDDGFHAGDEFSSCHRLPLFGIFSNEMKQRLSRCNA